MDGDSSRLADTTDVPGVGVHASPRDLPEYHPLKERFEIPDDQDRDPTEKSRHGDE